MTSIWTVFFDADSPVASSVDVYVGLGRILERCLRQGVIALALIGLPAFQASLARSLLARVLYSKLLKGGLYGGYIG